MDKGLEGRLLNWRPVGHRNVSHKRRIRMRVPGRTGMDINEESRIRNISEMDHSEKVWVVKEGRYTCNLDICMSQLPFLWL